MPNRIIKESICTSASIDGLSWFEEVFFYRLIVNCDDYGRFDARPAILRARLFPLKDITNKQIEAALSKLVTAGMARVYEYDRQAYLQLENWSKHQSVRNQKSKYPDPTTIEINCNQLHANVPVIQSESESNSESESESDARARADARFDEFWAAYPRKIGKGAAQKAHRKIKPNKELHRQMLDAVRAASATEQWRKNGGQYVPNPVTWLNQERWNDEIQEVKPGERFDERRMPDGWRATGSGTFLDANGVERTATGHKVADADAW